MRLTRPASTLAFASLATLALAPAADAADQLVYVPLDQPCRLLDTRVAIGGAGALSSTHGNYVFGSSDTDIKSAAQNGNAAGCGVPAGISAISLNLNQLNASGSGNVRAWSSDAGSAGPSAGTAVYNASVVYNGGYSTIAVGSDGRFYFAVSNGHIDVTANLVGYWLPLSWGADRSGQHALALGDGTSASGFDATALGGGTVASGNYATALGAYNTASGAYSVALGFNATTTGGALPRDNSFVFGDGSAATANTVDHQFMARARNGVVFYTATDTSTGVQLAAGSGAWTSLSDRRAKDALVPVDGDDVLARVVALPMSTWHYKTQDVQYRHMGPMAQDFRAAFGLGESDTGIDTIDADGVALAAIQGLNARLERDNADKDRRIAALQAQIDALAAAMSAAHSP